MKYSGVSVIMRSQPKGANLLKPKTYFMYHQLEHSEILCSAHTDWDFTSNRYSFVLKGVNRKCEDVNPLAL